MVWHMLIVAKLYPGNGLARISHVKPWFGVGNGFLLHQKCVKFVKAVTNNCVETALPPAYAVEIMLSSCVCVYVYVCVCVFGLLNKFT